MNSGIYKIINKINNKIYIGSTVNFKNRERQHWYCLKNNKHHNNHLQNSFNKYGENNFEFIIIELISKDQLETREQYWIDKLSTIKYGYNQRPDATSNSGIKHSKQSKKNMSDAAKKRGISKEHRTKMIAGLKGRKFSKETRKKISESHMGMSPSEETRKKISKSLMGNVPWNKGKKASEKTRKKLCEAFARGDNGFFGPHTDKARNKISQNRSLINLTYNGKTQNVLAWSKDIGIKPTTIRARLRRGWSVEKTLTTPTENNKGTNNARK